MAFFGLTAMGPQNCFQVSLLDFSYLDVFTAADMKKAFVVADRDGRGFLHADQVESFLTELYHGPPKPSDLARFMNKMKMIAKEGGGNGQEEGRVTLDQIRSAMAQLKEEVEEQSDKTKWHKGSGSDLTSNQSFRDMVRRHEFISRGPRERYARTVTAVQEHGWQDQLEINKQMVYGKKSCPETVYASELVKSGVYF